MGEFLSNIISELIVGIILSLIALIPFSRLIKHLFLSTRVESLFQSLKEYYMTTEAELKYQIKCYVPQTFKFGQKDTVKIKNLIKQIKQLKGSHFIITGKPASGKTTAMRYMYCKLARTYKCFYFQMRSLKDLNDFKEYLNEQYQHNNIKSGEKVIAFFDGIDEAIAFLQKEDFSSVFLKGRKSEMRQLFNELNINLENMIISMRPEFLENSISDLNIQNGNSYIRTFEVAEMSDQDVIKVFKSLKVLKKMDKKLPDDVQRHQNRYPEKSAGKYIKFLKTILKSSPNSIFHYPFYIRYAYAFMDKYKKDYENNWMQHMKGFVSDDNMASALDVLIKAVSKWEFHIYDRSDNRDHDIDGFYRTLQNCMSDIVKDIIENDEQEIISRERLQDIINHHCFKVKDEPQPMTIVISHCFMISDRCGNNFQFCHMIFYEYFLAKYLVEKADCKMRKNFLLAENRSEDFHRIYYGIFIMKHKELNKKFSASITNFTNRILKINDYMKLRDEEMINVADDPEISMEQIYNYMPEIQGFFYRGMRFTQEKMEQAMFCGAIDLSNTGWDYIRYINAIINPERVRELNISRLRLKDIDTLETYTNLKRLDVRNQGKDCSEYMQKVIEAVRNIILDRLYIYTEDGILCEQLDHMIEKGEFCAENIYVDTPDFSEAYRKLYQLKQQAEQAGGVFRFFVNKRTDLQKARLEYKKKNETKDHDLLKAVFEIEADERGVLGLNHNAEATLWNGLSLAEFYVYQDFTDEEKKAYQIYCRLEPYIMKDGSRLSAFYGKSFGRNLCQLGRCEKSKEWFTYADSLEEKEYFSDEEYIKIKLYLYRALVCCNEKDLNEYRKELYTRIEKLPDYQQKGSYVNLLKRDCTAVIHNWEKGKEPPECLEEYIRKFWRAAERYAETNKRYGYLFSAVYDAIIVANRMEKAEESARLLEKLENIMQQANKKSSDRTIQGHWIQYKEQKLYYLFLSKQYDEAIAVCDELMNYPYRTKAKKECDYQYIREACTQNEKDADIDKHRLWDAFWG